jgi:hypothetical protein
MPTSAKDGQMWGTGPLFVSVAGSGYEVRKARRAEPNLAQDGSPGKAVPKNCHPERRAT